MSEKKRTLQEFLYAHWRARLDRSKYSSSSDRYKPSWKLDPERKRGDGPPR